MVLELQYTHHNFRSFNFREYVACLILRPVTDIFHGFISRMQTNSRNSRKLIHRENSNVYSTIPYSHALPVRFLCPSHHTYRWDQYIMTDSEDEEDTDDMYSVAYACEAVAILAIGCAAGLKGLKHSKKNVRMLI